jgi:hypothetical protein
MPAKFEVVNEIPGRPAMRRVCEFDLRRLGRFGGEQSLTQRTHSVFQDEQPSPISGSRHHRNVTIWLRHQGERDPNFR